MPGELPKQPTARRNFPLVRPVERRAYSVQHPGYGVCQALALKMKFPEYWQAFVSAHDLAGASACVDEEHDLSGLGADLAFLTEAQANEELTLCWPGIGVAADGYIPVAWCSEGSGDYYYINGNDGANGPLYRIYHDSVGPQGYDPKEAIAKVLENYEALLGYVER